MTVLDILDPPPVEAAWLDSPAPPDGTRGPILDAALAGHRAGLCVLPAWPDQKRPILPTWKQYISQRPDGAMTEMMFRDTDRLGRRLFVVCGDVSGGVECIDFDDGGSAFAPWRVSVPAPLFERLAVEQSPSGGFHVVYRCPGVSAPRTQTLARTEAGTKLIETRGEGAGFVAHPSPGYCMVQGRFAALPVLSPDERETLLGAAAALNRYVAVPIKQNAPTRPAMGLPAMGGGVPTYLRTALEGECAKVAGAVETTRNDTLRAREIISVTTL